MSGNPGYRATAQWDGMPEEAMMRAEEQLAELADGSQGVLANYGWLIFIGAVVAIVALMLIYLAGRYRRDRTEQPDEQRSPLFDEVTDDTLESELVFDRDLEGDTLDAVVDVNGDDPMSEPLHLEPIDDRAENTISEVSADVIAMPAPETPPDDPHTDFETKEDSSETEEPRRYAFATSRPSGQSNATFGRGDASAEAIRESLQGGTASAKSTPDTSISDTSTDDDSGAYIAPFIRDDIDKSEQRQTERMDSLRDDMSRQVAAMKSEQASRLDLVIAAIDRKLESLDRRASEPRAGIVSNEVSGNVSALSEQVDRITSAIDGQGQRIRAITTILENRSGEVVQVHEEIKSMHGDVRSVREDIVRTGDTVSSVKGEIDEIKENVGKLERAILDRAAQDSSTIHRLTDVIRGTLPDGTYSFGTGLANGENADCLISFDGLREKVAIDAGFPMEAFHDLPSRDAVRRNLPQAKVSEDAFRRAILRSILEAADRCISPAETTDSCLLFLPSEAAYTILHDRFPDLVRDSQRARVWIVSPSTLMGTLNLIRNLLPDIADLEARQQDVAAAEQRRGEEDRLRQEVDSMRRRASGLAEELDRTRATLRDLISSTEQLNLGDDTDGPSTADLVAEPLSDEDDIIEGLRFDGTPEWDTPRRRDTGSSTLFEDESADPLR